MKCLLCKKWGSCISTIIVRPQSPDSLCPPPFPLPNLCLPLPGLPEAVSKPRAALPAWGCITAGCIPWKIPSGASQTLPTPLGAFSGLTPFGSPFLWVTLLLSGLPAPRSLFPQVLNKFARLLASPWKQHAAFLRFSQDCPLFLGWTDLHKNDKHFHCNAFPRP